jgi:hypothetical protein
MASNTKAHLEIHPGKSIPFGHIPVAYPAIYSSPYVRFVVEVDVIRDIVSPGPRDRNPIVQVP